MNATNIMASKPVTTENNFAKSNVSNNDKVMSKNSGKGNGKQEKGFGDILKQVVKEPDVVDDGKAGDASSMLTMMPSSNPVVVVDINQGLQSSVEPETAVPSLENLTENLFSKPDNKGGAFANVLNNSTLEHVVGQNKTIPQQLIGSNETNSTGQELLNMLNGKNLSDVQLNLTNTQIQGDNKQQLFLNSQNIVDVEQEKSLSSAVKIGNGNKSDLNQENLFSADQKNNSMFQTAQSEISPKGLKQPKVTMADLLKENNPKVSVESLNNTVDVVSKVEFPVNNQENSQQILPEFITNVVDVRSSVNSAIAQTVPTETPEPIAKYNIPDQIIDQARLIKTNEDTQMIIKLKPEHLGDLTLKVTVENGVVNATFHSDNVNVRSMLETSLFQLKQELIAQGIKVDNVSVYSGLGQFLSDGQGQANREQQSSKFKNRKVNLADFDEEVEKTNPVSLHSNESDGVDYRI